jgi:hypothetical protein
MFGLDTKSLVVGAGLGLVVLPRIVSFITSKMGGAK